MSNMKNELLEDDLVEKENQVRNLYEAFIAAEDMTWEGTTNEWLIETHEKFADVKIRDAFLNLFGSAEHSERVTVLASFSLLLDEYENLFGNEVIEGETLGYMVMIYGALAYTHAGAVYNKYKDQANKDQLVQLQSGNQEFKDVFVEAAKLGCNASLLHLLLRATEHEIPIDIFYQSIMNVSFEDCLKGAN